MNRNRKWAIAVGWSLAAMLVGCTAQKTQPSPTPAASSGMQALPTDWKIGETHRYTVLWKRDATVPTHPDPKFQRALEAVMRNETVGEVAVHATAHSGTATELIWEPRIDTPPSADASLDNMGALTNEMYRFGSGLKLHLRLDLDPSHPALQILNLAEARHAMFEHIQALAGTQAAKIGCAEESAVSGCIFAGKTEELLAKKLLKNVEPFFDCVGMRYQFDQPRRWTENRPIPNSTKILPINYEVGVDEIDAAHHTLRGHVKTQPDSAAMNAYLRESLSDKASGKSNDAIVSALASMVATVQTDCRMDTRHGWPLRTERTERADVGERFASGTTRYESKE